LCLSCRQDFTGKSNAKRHNDNLHSGQAAIVPIHKFLYGQARYYDDDPPFAHDTSSEDRKEIAPDALAHLTEEIGKEFEDLEHEIRFLNPLERKRVLGLAVHTCVATSHPKDTMRYAIKTQRNLGLRLRIVNCVATYLNINPARAQEILEVRLMSNPSRTASNSSSG
jgi:hypothetical protein